MTLNDFYRAVELRSDETRPILEKSRCFFPDKAGPIGRKLTGDRAPSQLQVNAVNCAHMIRRFNRSYPAETA